MTRLAIFQVDVFTREKFRGNPAGVILKADGLSAQDMQRIARELNNSETAFVFEPDADDHDIRIRFFTPTQEVPSCGHATLAAHYVRAQTQDLSPGKYWHKIQIGRLPVEIEESGDDYRIIMTQAPPTIGDPITGPLRKKILRSMNLSEAETEPGFPIVHIDTGNSKILIPVRSRNILNDLSPDLEAIKQIAREIPNAGHFVFTLNDPDPDITAHCRMFAPQIGIPEDPVTGNGNGPLGVYLVQFGIIGDRQPDLYLLSRQGEAMGRPGTAHIWVESKSGKPHTVKVGGDAIIAFSATLEI